MPVIVLVSECLGRYLVAMTNMYAVPADAGTLNERVARELNALRARYDRSQADLAQVIGVTQSQMSKRLKGTVPFTLTDIERFAAYFGITASDLLGYAESPHPTGPGTRVARKYLDSPRHLALAPAA